MLIRVLRSLARRQPAALPPTAAEGPPRAAARDAEPAYRGYYINLEASEERRRAMADQLERVGLARRYERQPAVDGRQLQADRFKLRPAEAACFLSHLGALEAGRRNGGHVHVMEDDVILGASAGRYLDEVCGRGVLAKYDLVYTDTLVPFKADLVRHYLRLCEQAAAAPADAGGLAGVQIVNLRGRFYACHASYLVNRDSLDRLIGLLRREVEAGMPLPIDLVVKRLVNAGELNAAVTVPFLTATRLEETLASTVQGEQYEALVSVLLHNLLRNQFFADRDDAAFERYFERYVARLELGGAARNAARLAAFFLSDAHRDF